MPTLKGYFCNIDISDWFFYILFSHVYLIFPFSFQWLGPAKPDYPLPNLWSYCINVWENTGGTVPLWDYKLLSTSIVVIVDVTCDSLCLMVEVNSVLDDTITEIGNRVKLWWCDYIWRKVMMCWNLPFFLNTSPSSQYYHPIIIQSSTRIITYPIITPWLPISHSALPIYACKGNQTDLEAFLLVAIPCAMQLQGCTKIWCKTFICTKNLHTNGSKIY